MKQSIQEVKQKYSDLVIQTNKQILDSFVHLKCPNHPNRELDQICISKHCKPQDQILFCSNCSIQNDQHIEHIKQHKTSLRELEQYLPSKIQEVSGASLLEVIDKQRAILRKAEEMVEDRTKSIMDEMESDFDKIMNNMNVLIQELLVESKKQIKQYQKEQVKFIRQTMDQINQYELQLNKEQSIVLSDIIDSLKQVDRTKNYQINRYMNKIKQVEYTFKVQQYVDQIDIKIAQFMADIHNTKFYNRDQTRSIEQMIKQELELPIQQNKFMLLQPSQSQVVKQKEERMVWRIEQDDEQQNQSVLFINNKTSKVSIQELQTVKTQHKLSINSVFIHNNCIITNGNDQQILFYQTNPLNLQLFLAYSLELEDQCCSIQIDGDRMIVGYNNGTIQIYDISDTSQPQQIRQYQLHNKQVKTIDRVKVGDDQWLYMSAGYDGWIGLFDTNHAVRIAKVSINYNPRISAYNSSDLIYYGNKAGQLQKVQIDNTLLSKFEQSVKSSGQQTNSDDDRSAEQYCLLEQNTIVQNKPIKLFQERITQLLVSPSQTLFISNDKGKILVIRYENNNIKVLSQIFQARSPIYGLILFTKPEKEQQYVDSYAVQLQWDQQLHIIDLKSEKSISSVKHQLNNNANKHFNHQSSRLMFLNYEDNQKNVLITAGNDDTTLQMFDLKFY